MIKEIDLSMPNKMWQHPWQLIHRVALHDKLKAVATAKEAPGRPAALYTSSKVASVDPDAGTLTFADGSTRTADLIIGADGIYVSILFFSLGSPNVLTVGLVENSQGTRGARDQAVWFRQGSLPLPSSTPGCARRPRDQTASGPD